MTGSVGKKEKKKQKWPTATLETILLGEHGHLIIYSIIHFGRFMRNMALNARM